MNSSQPVANFPLMDLVSRKPWPALDMETFCELHRKNAVALTNAGRVAFIGLSTLAQRQGDLARSTVEELGKAVCDTLATGPLEERVRKQTDAGRHIYDSSAAGFRDLCDIATKANVDTVDILSTRFTDALRELSALLAGSATAGATAARAVSTSLIAGPAVEDGDGMLAGHPDTAAEPSLEPAAEAAHALVIAEPAASSAELGGDEDARASDESKPVRKATPRSRRTTASPAAKAPRRRPPRR